MSIEMRWDPCLVNIRHRIHAVVEEEEAKEVEADKQSRYLGICNNMSGDLQENCATGLCGFNPK